MYVTLNIIRADVYKIHTNKFTSIYAEDSISTVNGLELIAADPFRGPTGSTAYRL